MKQLFDISSNFSFGVLLLFVGMMNVSIAGGHILFTILCLQLIIYGVRYLKNRKKGDGNPVPGAPKLPAYYKYFLLYILFTFFSTLFSINRWVSIKDNKEFFLFLLIPIFILILNTEKRLRLTFWVLLGTALINALRGIYQVVTLPQGEPLLYNRPVGNTSHWMTFAGLLMFGFIFFFIYVFYHEKLKGKLVIGGAMAVILAAVFFSLTRSVWVGMVLALGMFIVYYKPKILYAAIPLCIVLVFVLPDSVMSRFTSIFNLKDRTNVDRFYMYNIGLDIFVDYPFTGVGADNIESVYNDYKLKLLKRRKEVPESTVRIDDLPWHEDQKRPNPHLHNNIVHVLAERGLPALLSLLAAFVSIIVCLIKRVRGSTGLAKTVALGTVFAFTAFLAAGMFEYNFGDTEIKFILFYFLSIPFLAPSAYGGASGDGEHGGAVNGRTAGDGIIDDEQKG